MKAPTLSTPEHAKRRGILVTATLPIVALLAIVALKLLLMMLFGHLAVVFNGAGSYELAATVSKWNLVANVIEVHKAHYNLGTAYLGMELYDDSIDELLEALDTAPVPDSCWVRTNLALAYEGLGDQQVAAGDAVDAVYSYLVAENVLAGADPACASQSSSSSDDSDDSDDQSDSGGGGDQQDQGGGAGQQDQGSFGDQSAESQERLDQKASDAQDQVDEQAGQGGQGTDPNQGDPEDGDGDQPQNSNPFEELGEQMEQAQQQAESSNSEGRGEGGGFAIPDRPW